MSSKSFVAQSDAPTSVHKLPKKKMYNLYKVSTSDNVNIHIIQLYILITESMTHIVNCSFILNIDFV